MLPPVRVCVRVCAQIYVHIGTHTHQEGVCLLTWLCAGSHERKDAKTLYLPSRPMMLRAAGPEPPTAPPWPIPRRCCSRKQRKERGAEACWKGFIFQDCLARLAAFRTPGLPAPLHQGALTEPLLGLRRSPSATAKYWPSSRKARALPTRMGFRAAPPVQSCEGGGL